MCDVISRSCNNLGKRSLSSETGNRSADLSISRKKRELKSGPRPRCWFRRPHLAPLSLRFRSSLIMRRERRAMMLLRVQPASGPRCRQGAGRGSSEYRGRGGRRDVWASPGATGTHTTPLAFPRDRQTDRPIRGLGGGERYPATCSR